MGDSGYQDQRGATTVEYAVILVLTVLALIGVVIYMVNPADPLNSLLPGTYSSMGDRIGNSSRVIPAPTE